MCVQLNGYQFSLDIFIIRFWLTINHAFYWNVPSGIIVLLWLFLFLHPIALGYKDSIWYHKADSYFEWLKFCLFVCVEWFFEIWCQKPWAIQMNNFATSIL